MSSKKPSYIKQQQAALKAKVEALSGKRLRQAGLLPAQRRGDPPPVATSKLPLWPLLLLLPLLLIPLRPKEQRPQVPPPLTISLPQVVFPKVLTLLYSEALLEEAEACQKLFQTLGIELMLEPLYSPATENNCLYLLDKPLVKRWQAQGLLAPIPLSQKEGLPIRSLIYPSLWAELATEKNAPALPVAVAPPLLFVKKEAWERAGFSEAQIPTSWEEVLSLLPKLKEFDPDGVPRQVPFWPFEESPLLWTLMLDQSLGQKALATTAAWLGQLWYQQKLTANLKVETAAMVVTKKPLGSQYYRALPPTPTGSASRLLAKVSYLASPGAELAAKLPLIYLALVWKLPSGLLPPVLGTASGVELAALCRATSLSLEPAAQEKLIMSIYEKIENNRKERKRASD